MRSVKADHPGRAADAAAREGFRSGEFIDRLFNSFVFNHIHIV